MENRIIVFLLLFASAAVKVGRLKPKEEIYLQRKLFQAKSDNFECDDKPSILCLARDYSTFDLPFRQKPNLIKIGR